MKRPLSIYSFVPRIASASFYYRIRVPLSTANDCGIPIYARIDTNDAAVSQEQRVNAVCESDAIILYQPIGDTVAQQVKSLQSLIPAKRNGEWMWPPSFLIDTDDNLFNVSPLNPAYKTLGINDGAGRPVPPDSVIGMTMHGEQRILYSDGKDGFDILANRHRLETYRNLLNMSDGVICSTPTCEQYIKDNSKARRTFVNPNLVRFDHYEQVEVKTKPGQIRIMHQGGANHYQDLYPLREAMGRLTKKYPQVHWLFWGALYPWVTHNISPERFTYYPWCDYSEYKLRLVMMGHHINLAPLADSTFNRCRTAIKWYESSVLKVPAATLAQNTGPYKDEMEDGKTGLLYNNPQEFEEKLSRLIENEQERLEYGRNSKDWISDHRNAFKEVHKWVEFLEMVREERKIEQPRLTEGHWQEIEEQIRKAEEADQKVEDNEPVHAVG